MDEFAEAVFRSFVAARSPALLRTAYLLVGDRDRAEELLPDGGFRIALPGGSVCPISRWTDSPWRRSSWQTCRSRDGVPGGSCMSWRSFVAIGDSFTEGLDDPYPDGRAFRGWADLLAGRLAMDAPDFGYANLAIRGRLFNNIVDEQVPIALRLRPDLISFAAGGNDVLRRGFDPYTLLARFDQVVGMLRASGADVLIFRFADVTRHLPGKRLLGTRTGILNTAVGEVSARHGARMVDLFADDEFANPRLWSIDRLHLSAAGHRRVAAHALAALGVEAEPAWLQSPPAPRPLPWARARRADLEWATRHLAPWVKRRLTGRSSGDLISAKRPDLSPYRLEAPTVEEDSTVHKG